MYSLDLQDIDISKSNYQVCSKCIYDSRVSNIIFDDQGVCNYCHQIDKLKQSYGTGTQKGIDLLNDIIRKIKIEGSNKKYDCIVGVSGGTDSSYLIYLSKKWGLRPLAVHFDNTWNTAVATMNIHNVLKGLDIDLYTHVVNNKEMDDIIRSFILAGVAETEAATDMGFAYLLRVVARKYSIRYILEGHSFTEEGITPIGRNYFDGKYIKSIHKKFGTRKMKTYPLMTFSRFMRSILLDRVKFIRPLWYINYSKKEAHDFLTKEFGWKYYGGKHYESRWTNFFQSYYLPKRFGYDKRLAHLTSLVLANEITREEALTELKKPLYKLSQLKNDINYISNKLNITEKKLKDLIEFTPKREYTEYRNNKHLRDKFYRKFYHKIKNILSKIF